MKKLLILSLLILSQFENQAQSLAQRRCDSLGLGFNIGNWLESYWSPTWPDSNTTYPKTMLMAMKEAGFKSIRFPIGFASITDTFPPYAVDTTSAVWPMIDTIIKWTDELGMNLIIDNHHNWVLADTSWRKTAPRLSHLWGVVAKKYSYLDPEKYMFEILNEPFEISNDSIRALFTVVVDSIRQYAPNHTIITSPTAGSGGVAYGGYLPMADTNLIYSFHTYDPLPYTHQGFTWMNPSYPAGTTYPNSGYDWMVSAQWNAAMTWKNTYNLPMFLGEFGVGINSDEQSRCNWIDTVGRRIDENNLPAFCWDVLYGFKVFNSATVSEDSVLNCYKVALHLYGDNTAGIKSVSSQLNNTITVFPNPAEDRFSVYSPIEKNISLSVFDSFGKLIATKSFSENTTIHTQDWAKGIYIVKLNSTASAAQIKLVIR